ncbi:MAG: YggS family pyridoxal phosphate-dependent enzyme [Mangrovibacterium sp.]
MSITDNLSKLKSGLPNGVCLVAVSKTHPATAIMEAYNAGQRVFGENKVQELCQKHEQLPNDIRWHFIGHLQSNKVKYLAPFIDLVHGIDSLKLLKTIDKEAAKNDRVLRCLLQFHVADEESKFGLNLGEARELLRSADYAAMRNVQLCGVMGMATFTDEQEQVRREFRQLKNIFDQLKTEFFGDKASFSEISMGMSGDYLLAVEEGSTMIRMGSAVFGERHYP